MTRVLVVDNYDSFVYNLVQYLGELGAEPLVHRHDALTVADAEALEPDAVLISPGPGRPGPGLMSTASGSRSSAAGTVIASLRCTSGSAPSSPRYWTKM